jgi:beta-glucanase (GH16 family)
VKFVDDLSTGFHDYGVLWTPTEMIFEIDGEPVAAVVTNNAVNAPADVMFASALSMPECQSIPRGTPWL